MEEKEEKPVKDRECIRCQKFFDCNGKPHANMNCISFEKRTTNLFTGREKAER